MANQRVHGGKQTAGSRYNIFFCLFGYHLFFFYESEDIKHRDEGAAVQPTGTAALIRAKRVSFKIGRWQVGVQTQHGGGGGGKAGICLELPWRPWQRQLLQISY